MNNDRIDHLLKSQRTARRERARVDSIGESTINALASTSLRTGQEHDALAALPDDMRSDLIARALNGEPVSAKAARTELLLTERAVYDARLTAFQTAFRALDASQRTRALEWLAIIVRPHVAGDCLANEIALDIIEDIKPVALTDEEVALAEQTLARIQQNGHRRQIR